MIVTFRERNFARPGRVTLTGGVSGRYAMKPQRDWSFLWYAAVLGAAVAWGYAPPAGSNRSIEDSLAQRADGDNRAANHLELRRVAQQMILR